MLTGLGPECEFVSARNHSSIFGRENSVHLPIRSSNDNDSTVHVGSTSNHVLNVIGVARAVDVGVVAAVGLELDVGRRNSDTTLALLGSLVNGTIVEEAGQALGGLVLGDGGSQGSLCSKNGQIRIANAGRTGA